MRLTITIFGYTLVIGSGKGNEVKLLEKLLDEAIEDEVDLQRMLS